MPVEVEEAVLGDKKALLEKAGPAKRDPSQTVYVLLGRTRAGRYLTMARKIFREEGVPEDIVWLGQVESAWRPVAVSHKGAGGLPRPGVPEPQQVAARDHCGVGDSVAQPDLLATGRGRLEGHEERRG